ncbi:MAG: hypothetical protein A2452_10870 [Candidatus Firestonebacteria bacterium RIFOXYC2_FULL_39_67]|nr:MAG: hypothetical protein A2536_08770 [Candidatus Firestonebacteria bacterium RIFOXYD2_FULL_39_29]OGF55958.1 MAG: hypothetical protein A2452_10870 [Candidatus Firestonebacteria bacterium RIFOXYC2_FULL_39_67]OGF56681.1 MAG: hypothetical protein A2497_06170 [Candidatus Firestonebacteria bacterium RifOxyC12_full_39_7]
MGIFGVGRRILAVAMPCLLAAIVLKVVKPDIMCIFAGRNILLFPGLLIMVAGLAINVLSVKRMLKAFKEGKLLTDGTYAFSRHPIYSSYILFTVPGLAVALNSWAVLLVSPLALLMFLLTVSKEEEFLEKQFGAQYAEYKRRTGILFTIGRFKI